MLYRRLFTPFQLGSTTLKNRVVMGSMHTNLEELPQGFERLAAFYGERAKGQVGLIITGGISPNPEGILAPNRSVLDSQSGVAQHQLITEAVKQHGTKICMQILHAGRYGYQPQQVAPSAIQAPISPYTPKELTTTEIEKQITDFVNCAKLAKQAGYDGVEIMGSEGYLINQFIVKATNKRTDEWGGSYQNRIRFAIEIVKRVREALGAEFILIFRLSLVDLVTDGSTFDEVLELAHALEGAGVDMLNSGIGWHESRIPTIVTSVPRALFSSLSQRLKAAVSVPVITSNRINTPEVAEQLLQDEHADFISMARPFLADSQFVAKAKVNNSEQINTCIACNQACLDNIFVNLPASCIVNPRACNETLMPIIKAVLSKQIAIVGGGAAGMACAIYAAERGHQVSLFESSSELGGQLILAANVPGKEEFKETLRYFKSRLMSLNIEVKMNVQTDVATLSQYDHCVIATGVKGYTPSIVGVNHPCVVGYQAVLDGTASIDGRVAIIGAGGIGFDVASYITGAKLQKNTQPADLVFSKQWGIDLTVTSPGGVISKQMKKSAVDELPQVYLLQRKLRKHGADLGKTTGWIHREHLKHQGVKMLAALSYEKIDEQGLHISVRNRERLLAVDHIIICSGQESVLPPYHKLLDELTIPVSYIGGALTAEKLDLQRAIGEAFNLAQRL
ncbi:NADPH-dependent 2,4-dienoyl-CoA reductase [Pseudoalteromonas sp. KG3]|uniref:NADPH-dependent 2,4-dienoyl-CoA reductase n=2 Tax=Pseudoalteromonas TaxID=53246 RepID=A0ABR9FL58_9GAMM|nr:NADPH-dependent 2,4-dienoyl-CoA reductase [Pseudoalteromonas prydzensis]MBE0457554.1 NADPH-dependent 2,4-dienoyl-CoA reductase [Pseudoalteromonas prydzensis]WKD26110.1 NADPH-dependent 2,4-dienoyl-CoA reductase [Pseudoalteromonas sp. KG3]